MLVGYPPFYADNPFGIYEKILNAKYEWPRLVDPVAKDLVKKLLVPDRTKRLGNMKNGCEDIRRHRWFKNLDWDDVYNRKLTVNYHLNMLHSCKKANQLLMFNVFSSYSSRVDLPQPPIIPKVKSDGDTSNFDDYPDEENVARAISQKDSMLFDDF